MRRTLEERKALLARLPWVALQAAPTPRCDGIKWSKMSLRDSRTYHREGLEALPDRARCRRQGWYGLRALKPRGSYPPPEATSGVYCFDHLCMQISDHPKEHDRLRRWLEQNEPSWL